MTAGSAKFVACVGGLAALRAETAVECASGWWCGLLAEVGNGHFNRNFYIGRISGVAVELLQNKGTLLDEVRALCLVNIIGDFASGVVEVEGANLVEELLFFSLQFLARCGCVVAGGGGEKRP